MIRWICQVLGIATAYFLCGKAALLLAIPPGYATAVWPASGIALAAVLVLGYRILPGIAIGSFLVNIGTSLDTSTTDTLFRSILVTTSIGLGAVIEALLGAALVRRYVGFPTSLTREREVVAFITLGGPVACLAGSTWGIVTLITAGVVTPNSALFSWWTWWVGDTIGVMIFCPLVLLFTAKPRQIWRPRQIPVGLPLCVTFALAVLLFIYASMWERNRQRSEFEHQADTLAQAFQRQSNADLDALRSVQALFSVADQVDRDQFQRFVALPLARHPGLLALDWLPRVRNSDRAAWERSVQAEGLEDFQITQRDANGQLVRASERETYFPICYIEPEQGNRSALGFDPSSEPDRAAMLAKARDTGEAAASDSLVLIQDPQKPTGVVICLPVYEAGTPHALVEQRRKNLKGFVAAVYRIDTFVMTALGSLDRQGIDLSLIDESAPEASRTLYTLASDGSGHPDGQVGGLVYTSSFELAGRRWTLRAVRSNEYLLAHPSWNAWVVLAGGLLFTSLLGGFLLVLTGRTMRIELEVAERTAELHLMHEQLHQAKDSAETANEAKTLFLANMSHEIRTPLTAVIGFADLLLDPGRRIPDQMDCLDTIRRNASHLLELVNEVLDISKIESGRLVVETQLVDLSELALEIMQMMHPQAIAKGLRFTLTCDGPIPGQIRTDRLRLRQVLLNLISNALKFTDTGGVRIQLSAVAVHATESGQSFDIRFEVSDSGIGLSPEQIGRLFQTFSQADSSTTRRFGGTGLGLAISQRLASLLNGRINVVSKLGNGSAFTLVIRADAPAGVEIVTDLQKIEPKLPVGSALPASTALHGRVLLAEDGRDNARFISMVLTDAGAEVVIAENGHRVVELATTQRFDLILMDMQMPVQDGYAATAQIRSRGNLVPIVALTADAVAEDRTRAIAAGCCEYLIKPIEPERLRRTVARHLSAQRIESLCPPAATDLPQRMTHRSTLAGIPNWKKLLDQYTADLPSDVALLSDLFARNEMNELARILHQMVGSGGNYGFPAITTLARSAEHAIHQGQIDEATLAFSELIQYMRGVEGYDAQAENDHCTIRAA